MFILISHYYTIVFESFSEKQRFAFTTRTSRIFCKGGRISARGLGTLSWGVLSIIEDFPVVSLKYFIKNVKISNIQ